MKLEAKPMLGAFALGATALAIGLPLRDRENLRRVIGAIAGNGVDCTGCIESERTTYDAIVVPGGGLNRTNDGLWLPSPYAQLRLEAAVISREKQKEAAVSYEQIAPTIVLLDGQPGPKQDQFANRNYLFAAAEKRGIVLPEEAVKNMDWVSANTRGNMERLKDVAKENAWTDVLIMSNWFHKDRATLFACREGVASSSRSAEEVILEAEPHRKAEIDALYASREARVFALKDRAEVVTMLWDPNGRAQTIARKAMLWARQKVEDRLQAEVRLIFDESFEGELELSAV